MPPAIVSASIHISEVVTMAALGIAFIGAYFLSDLPGDVVKLEISLFLLMLGFYVIFRFLIKVERSGQEKNFNLPAKQVVPVGLITSFADANGGGANYNFYIIVQEWQLGREISRYSGYKRICYCYLSYSRVSSFIGMARC